ncbi:MAG: hypothetical protein GWN99_12980 [Gemmatimonadetes bacterium]|uniref:Peptidoglycan-binding protein n=1 Tax=Candidatus Kutchimonas denitrificans TaxID=3056748 RepID=A0AAE4ZAS6_9BACT|nr:hypothetical protein [Gemmatimonadota bacterium]NIR75792.1 hypothetical protein [Candidatus Kutchimonas denitrificans]NIS01960.1 hypothetical protein [Gemmatimonadota bacterium]NIT67764.1 hypothetical protein [Gemmatimonadota bacterium]NIU53751.1 hypothetical protein [Gemmatimonadota bacterium]
MTRNRIKKAAALLGAAVIGTSLLTVPRAAWTHCDTLDGPVVAAARQALSSGDVTPTLKWVTPAQEAEVKQAFRHAVKVRALGPEARELADTHFFETLVRLHRESEGAPYTGLKPAGSVTNPAVLAADEALERGSVDSLVALVVQHVEHGLRERFERTYRLKARAEDSVEAGRAYVAAYVEFVHYAEALHSEPTSHGAEAPGH